MLKECCITTYQDNVKILLKSTFESKAICKPLRLPMTNESLSTSICLKTYVYSNHLLPWLITFSISKQIDYVSTETPPASSNMSIMPLIVALVALIASITSASLSRSPVV